MDPLSLTDLEWILHSSYPTLTPHIVRLMSTFADSLGRAVNELGLFGSKGSPWDFNLRDLLRWASLVVEKGSDNPNLFVDFVYGRRMRTKEDAEKVLALYSQTCSELGSPVALDSLLRCGQTGVALMEKELVLGNAVLARVGERGRETNETPLLVLQKQLPALESLALTLEMGWMPILVSEYLYQQILTIYMSHDRFCENRNRAKRRCAINGAENSGLPRQTIVKNGYAKVLSGEST